MENPGSSSNPSSNDGKKKAKKSIKFENNKAKPRGLIADLPVLSYNKTGFNNFIQFRESMSSYALTHFGTLGRIFKNLQYPEIEEVELPDAEDLNEENDPGGFLAHTIRAKITERTKIREQREEKKSHYTVQYGVNSLSSPKIKSKKRPTLMNLRLLKILYYSGQD